MLQSTTSKGSQARAVVAGHQPVVDPSAFVAPTATLVGGSVAVGALVHGGAVLPDEFFLPPSMVAVGDPVQVHPPVDPAAMGEAVRSTEFAKLAFGVEARWEDRIARYQQAAEVRSRELAAHADDEEVPPGAERHGTDG